MAQEAVGSTNGSGRGFLGVLLHALAYLVAGLSVVGVLICLAATVGVWLARGSIEERTAAGVARLDAGLSQAQQKLQRVNAGLSTVNDADLDPTLTTLSATVVNVNSALQALNAVPFVDVPALDTDRLQALSGRVQQGLTKAAAASQAAEVKTADLEAQLAAAQEQVNAFGAAADRWTDRAAIALTLLFLWLALAQASLLRSAWRYARSGS